MALRGLGVHFGECGRAGQTVNRAPGAGVHVQYLLYLDVTVHTPIMTVAWIATDMRSVMCVVGGLYFIAFRGTLQIAVQQLRCRLSPLLIVVLRQLRGHLVQVESIEYAFHSVKAPGLSACACVRASHRLAQLAAQPTGAAPEEIVDRERRMLESTMNKHGVAVVITK
jgi:hypothetical protein